MRTAEHTLGDSIQASNDGSLYLSCFGINRSVMQIVMDLLRDGLKSVCLEQIIEEFQHPFPKKELGEHIEGLVERGWLERGDDGQLQPSKLGLRAFGEDRAKIRRIRSSIIDEPSLTDCVNHLLDLLLRIREDPKFKHDPRVTEESEILQEDLYRWAFASGFTRESCKKAIAILVRMERVIVTPIGGAVVHWQYGMLVRAAPDAVIGSSDEDAVSSRLSDALVTAEDERTCYTDACYNKVIKSILLQAEKGLRARIDRIPCQSRRRDIDDQNGQEDWPSAGVPLSDVVQFVEAVFPNALLATYGPLSEGIYKQLEELVDQDLRSATAQWLSASFPTQYAFWPVIWSSLQRKEFYVSDARIPGTSQVSHWCGPVIRIRRNSEMTPQLRDQEAEAQHEKSKPTPSNKQEDEKASGSPVLTVGVMNINLLSGNAQSKPSGKASKKAGAESPSCEGTPVSEANEKASEIIDCDGDSNPRGLAGQGGGSNETLRKGESEKPRVTAEEAQKRALDDFGLLENAGTSSDDGEIPVAEAVGESKQSPNTVDAKKGIEIDEHNQTIIVDGERYTCDGHVRWKNFMQLWEARPDFVQSENLSGGGKSARAEIKEVRKMLKNAGVPRIGIENRRSLGYRVTVSGDPDIAASH